jgi:hypothetical protein
MVIRSVGVHVVNDAEGSGKFAAPNSLQLPRSCCHGSPGAADAVGADSGVIIVVNQVCVVAPELEGDSPVAGNPDRPASIALLWPDGTQKKTRNVHVANVRCGIERHQKHPQSHGMPGRNSRSTARFVEALQPLMPE